MAGRLRANGGNHGVTYPTPPPLVPSPIQITAANHGYKTGQKITIAGVGGITAANGTWTVTVLDPNNFTLNGSIGSGAYTSGGVAINQDWGGCHVWISPDNSNYVQVGTMYGPSRMGALTGATGQLPPILTQRTRWRLTNAICRDTHWWLGIGCGQL